MRRELVPLLLAGAAALPLAAQDGRLDTLKYRHPGLEVDLQVGLWAFPLPMDADGDGRLDLVVSCVDEASTGTYAFLRPPAGAGPEPLMPLFQPGRKLSFGRSNVQVSEVEGVPRVLRPGAAFPDFLNSGLEKPASLHVKADFPGYKTRSNRWSYADVDGDGLADLVLGIDDWTDYGWSNAWDAEGRWTRGPVHGYVYWLRNQGTAAKPRYAAPLQLQAGGAPMEVFGSPSPCLADFRGTGVLDVICGEFLDGFTFFANTGTRTEPVYAAGRRLRTSDGAPLAMNLQMVMPTVIDWNRDGRPDLVVGEEDGRVALIENSGRCDTDGVPVFLPPRYFRQQADEVDLGALATPVGVDWDGDGLEDMVSGNTAGQILFLRNLGPRGAEQPRWAVPVALEAAGRPIRIMAGANGSLQGPAEAKWGYTALSVADWDGDGLPDLVVNSIWGKVVWFRNTGTRTAPRLAAAQPVEVEWDGPQPAMPWGWLRPEGKALLTQWRTTPVAVDWDRDGLMDLVMVDQEGVVSLFRRARTADGRLVLRHPERCFLDEKGRPLRLNRPYPDGYIGCKKLCIADWDGDGMPDILVSNHPVLWLRQVPSTRPGTFMFKASGVLGDRSLGDHDSAPGVVDWNLDGIPDLVVGPEGGHIYYLRNPRTPPAR